MHAGTDAGSDKRRWPRAQGGRGELTTAAAGRPCRGDPGVVFSPTLAVSPVDARKPDRLGLERSRSSAQDRERAGTDEWVRSRTGWPRRPRRAGGADRTLSQAVGGSRVRAHPAPCGDCPGENDPWRWASTSALERLGHPTWHLGPVRSRSVVKTLEPCRGATGVTTAAAADEAEIAGTRPGTGNTKRCFLRPRQGRAGSQGPRCFSCRAGSESVLVRASGSGT